MATLTPSVPIRRIYDDGRYAAAHPTWHAERGPWKAAHVLRGLRAARLTPRRLCDIGCGTGVALAEVAKGLGGHPVAVGFEPAQSVRIDPEARAWISHEHLPAEMSQQRFDVAMMLDVFEHVEDPFALLRSTAHLAPHHVFHIPLDATVAHLLRSGFLTTRDKAGHLHCFTRETAFALLQETGHRILHWHWTQTWRGPGRSWSAKSMVREVLLGAFPDLGQKLIGGAAILAVTAHSAGAKGAA